jgi:hypothetical protein
MKFTPKPKRKGYGLETKTFRGRSGKSYVVHRTYNGAYHVFLEVESKKAAVDCGAPSKGPTRSQWAAIWNKRG